MQVDHLPDSFVLRGAANLFISREEAERASCREKAAAIHPETFSFIDHDRDIGGDLRQRDGVSSSASLAVAARAKRRETRPSVKQRLVKWNCRYSIAVT